jgi:hypothetical protein
MPKEIINVTCPWCQQKNLLLKRSTKGIYTCGHCQSQLSDPFISTKQTQSALKSGKIGSLSVLVGIGLLVFFGRIFLGGSQSPPISSAPVTSQPKTVPNRPIVIPKNRSLPSSTVLVSPAKRGRGSLKVSNGTGSDAYIKLVDPLSRKLVAAFYVKSSSAFKLKKVPDGTYQVLFVLGEDWDSKTRSFTGSKSFAKFDRSLSFTTTQSANRIQYRVFELTLNPVVGGDATTSRVGEQEFTRY